MIQEIDIYGVFLPSLLAWMVLAYFINSLIRRLLSVSGAYIYIWHPPLFDIAVYVIVLGAVVMIVKAFT